MRRNIVLLAVIAIVLSLVSISRVNAGIPEIISYQGILADSNGSPLTGWFSITVRIYDQASGGAVLWSETHSNVSVGDGKFNLLLGSVTSLSGSLDFDVPYWLGVSIDGGAELTPRTQFASTATAFAAQKVLERVLPAGMVAPFATATPPPGWLQCRGQTVSRTTYADLFAAIGTMYGVGDGSTTFKLPDYRGRFLRGWANGSGVDPDRANRTDRGDGTVGDVVGSKQWDQFKSHTHNYYLSINAQSEDGDKNNPKGFTNYGEYASKATGGGGDQAQKHFGFILHQILAGLPAGLPVLRCLKIFNPLSAMHDVK